MLRDATRPATLDPAVVPNTLLEPALDRLTALARDAVQAAGAYIMLVADDRQVVASCTASGPARGSAGGLGAGDELPLSHSLCRHAVAAGAPLVIVDGPRDPRFRDHPAVRELGVVAYLGAPITTADGRAVGTVCVTEPAPRAWAAHDIAVLEGVAAAAGREFDLRAANARLAEHEREVAEHRAALGALLDATSELVCAVGPDGRIAYVNAAWERALGYTRAEAARIPPLDLVAPEDRDRYRAVAARLLAGEAVDDFEAALVARDGRRVVCRGRATAELRDGRCVGTRACYRDVTAERAAEAARAAAAAALREREARLDLIYNSASDLMFLMRVEAGAAGGARVYRCASVNAAYHAVTGLTDAQLVGRPIEAIVPPAHAAFVRARYDEAVDGGAVLRYEERVALPSGDMHVETTLTPVRDAAGRCTHLLGVARDVTARRAAEEAVRASEARLRAMSAATPVGVFEADLTGGVRYVNPRMCELWDLDEPDVLGDGWRARVHVDDLPALLADWGAAVAAGREFSCVYRLLVPAGRGVPRVRWVHGRAAPLRDEAGRVVGGVGTVEDVTERHRADTTQRRLTGILEAMPDVVTVAAPNGRIEYLNAAGRRLLGVAGGPEAVRAAGLQVAALQPQFAPGGASAGAVAAALVDGAWRGETTLTKCDGRETPVEQVILAHRGADGEIEYLSSVLRDVTERKQAESTLRAFALVDELTGLYNRRGFLALAEREWEAARAAGQGGVLVYLDLDGFKPVNDTYGHAEGDRALQAVAAVLRRTFRDADVVGRLGGDEFVAFGRCGHGAGASALESARATAARVQQRLHALLAEANRSGVRPYALAASAGVALFDPAAPTMLAALMVEADAALYDRKRARQRVAVAA